jgi:hypothetical protein
MALPDKPDLMWLRRQAKRRLALLKESDPGAQLADAQFALAKEHGFSSWRALKAYVDSQTERGRLFDAARQGDTAALASLLDRDPALLDAREPPYEWTLLHAAAERGRLAIVDLLLKRGSIPTRARKGTTPTRCTGRRPPGISMSSGVLPTRVGTSSATATITSSR